MAASVACTPQPEESIAFLTHRHADRYGHGGGESEKTTDDNRKSAHGTAIFKGMFGQ